MTAIAQYLGAAAAEEFARRLEHRGYRVDRGQAPFDLVASRDGERIAYHVVVRPAPQEVVATTERLRRRALDDGFTEFRTVFATEPKWVLAEVEGLDEHLGRWLTDHMPPELRARGAAPDLEGVVEVALDELSAKPNHMTAAGTATAVVRFHRDGQVTTTAIFPLTFRVRLAADLAIEEVESLSVDTSEWFETVITPAED